jgi:tubulin epsilon
MPDVQSSDDEEQTIMDTRFNKPVTKTRVGVIKKNQSVHQQHKIRSLKARAVLVDMEEGVLNNLLKGDLADLFDQRQFLSDVSGSGNNWAHGHEVYGPKYYDDILDKINMAVEHCDSLQSFFVMHSMGGGTGSGLGTFILQLIRDNFPDVYRFSCTVFPSEDDDVITSPYNALLAASELIENSDCVLPIENQALLDMCNKVNGLLDKQKMFNKSGRGTSEYSASSAIINNKGGKKKDEKPFDQMNNIAANLITNLTSSMRFEGSLNVDMNEITMNLVPYPKLKFLISSLSPLVMPKDVNLPPRRFDQMFTDGFKSDYQLIKCDPIRQGRYLACGLMVRGKAQISDINRNIATIKANMDMIYWNQEGFKVGLCNIPPIGQPYSLLCLSNNCCMKDTFQEMEDRFKKLYRKKVYVHHYTQYMDEHVFTESMESIHSLISEYERLQNAVPPTTTTRFVPEFL